MAATAYSAVFDAPRPPAHARAQVALRLVLLMLLGVLGASLGWLLVIAYFALPAVAAVLISRDGSEGFVARDAPGLAAVVGWLVAVFAYFALVTDRFPVAPGGVRFSVQAGGRPTVGTALLRLVTSLPWAIAFVLLGVVSAIAWVAGVVFILAQQSLPVFIHDFQRGCMRWLARLLAYHASLVEEPPPFSFEAGPDRVAA